MSPSGKRGGIIMRAMKRDGQVSTEVKMHYKMYKAGKLWLVAGIGFVGTMMVLGGQPVAASAATDTEAVRDSVVEKDDAATSDANSDVDVQTKTPSADNVQQDATQATTDAEDTSEQTPSDDTGKTGTTATGTGTDAADVSEAVTGESTGTSAPEVSTEGSNDSVNTSVAGETATESAPATQTQENAGEQSTTPAAEGETQTSAAATQKEQVDATSTTLNLQAEQSQIKSGETATFDFNLNVSGIESDSGAQQLLVNLPSDFAPSDTDLSINGVTPTLDEATNQLVYDFAGPQNGLTVSKRFNFATESGDIKNQTPLTMSASFVDGDTVTESGDQTVLITSKAIYGVAAQFIGVLPTNDDGSIKMDANGDATIDQSKLTGRAGDLVAYAIGVSTPKQVAGQAYIEPGTQVQVRAVLPVGMTFVSVDSSTPQPVVNTTDAGQTILDFYLPAPSLEEQAAATKNLLTAQFNIVGRINSDVPVNTDLTVGALMGATSINGEKVQSEAATSTIRTVPDYSQIGYTTDGSQFYFYQWGPKDGAGAMASPEINTDPQVYPNATLNYLIQLGSADYDAPQGPDPAVGFENVSELKLTKDGYVRKIQSYVATYDVDDHLNIQTMSVGAPYATLEGNILALDEAPKFSLYVKYQDEDKYESTPILADITDTAGRKLDMTKLLDNNRGVDKLQFVWTTPVAGQTYDNIRFTMTPKVDYYGTVTNSLTVNVSGFDWLGWLETRYDKTGAYTIATVPGYPGSEGRVGLEVHLTDEVGNPIEPGSANDYTANYNQYMTDKTAEIIKPAENTPRVLNESIGFANVTDGKIDPGTNQMLIDVDNNKASLQSFSNLTTYVILPAGVTYTGNDAQVTAQAVDGMTLLTINWQQGTLAPNSANTLALDIDVNEELNLKNLAFGLYSTVSEADTVVPRTIDPSDASDVQIYNGANLPGLQLTQKVYALEIMGGVNTATGHQVMATAAAANAAGEIGALVTVNANEDGQYLLNLANTTDKALQELTLLATLPQEGDTAVLDSTARGTSTNAVKLSGPIQLPASWQGRATVAYLTADAPNGLAAADVSDFSQVTGFIVSYNDAFGYLDGSSQQIVVPVHVAADAVVGSQAFISYGIQANRLQQVEGLKAGITVGARQQASATVTYHDATTNTDLRVDTATTNAELTGDLNTTSTYDSAATIGAYLQQGYELVSDATKNADGSSAIAFTTEGSTTNYQVVLKHTYTADAPRTVTQTIHYVNGAGKIVAPDHVASQSFVVMVDQVTQQAQTYTAFGKQDAPVLTEGVPTGASWQQAAAATFAAVTNPTITDYHVVATTAADGNLEQVSASLVQADSADQLVTVTYAADTSEVTPPVATGTLTVRYVDDHGTTLLPNTTQSGDLGTSYAVSAPQITGYRLMGSGTAQGSFTAAPQTIAFIYTQIVTPPDNGQTLGTLTVHYVDDAGQTLLPDTTQSGTAGTSYNVSAPSITNYTVTGQTSASGTFATDARSITFVYKQNASQPITDEPGTDETPGGHNLPNTFDEGDTTPEETTKPSTGTSVSRTQLPSTGDAITHVNRKSVAVTKQVANTTQRNLPQTGEKRTNVLALLGLGLLALTSGAWLRKREY
jgi:LPXTG-motif cell wall-anchored protein